jgi:hypothetical protein
MAATVLAELPKLGKLNPQTVADLADVLPIIATVAFCGRPAH